MINGRFRYEESEQAYDHGTLIVDITESETSYRFKIVEKDMWYTTYVDLLFKGKKSVVVNKGRSPHGVRAGVDWITVYPERRGVPLCFCREEPIQTY